MFLHPVTLVWLVIYFAIHAAILCGLVRIINEGDKLDLESSISAVLISAALGMGWQYAADYWELHVALRWLSYVPLAGLIGLVVALVSGIPVVRAMGVGAMYVVFLLSWIVFAILVCGLVAWTTYRQRGYAKSRRDLRDRLTKTRSTTDSGEADES